MMIITNNVIVFEKAIYVATLYVNISKHGMKAFQPLHLQKPSVQWMFLNFLVRTGPGVFLSYNFNSIFNIIFGMLDVLVEYVKIC